MAKMVTLKPHRFAGRQRIAGEKYEASGQAKRLSEALGWAEEAKPEPVQPVAKVMPARHAPRQPAPQQEPRADAVATDGQASAVDVETQPQQGADGADADVPATKPRRTYSRRNLTAEE